MTLKPTLIFGFAIANMICGGTLYTYSLYGPQFSTKLGYSQVQTNFVAIAGEAGMYMTGPICGAVVDFFGPRIGCQAAAIFLLVGYVGMAATYSGALPTSSFIAMSIFFAMCGFGSTCSYMSTISTLAKTFTSHRGVALGIPIACYGLSAFIWTTMSGFLFVHNGELDIKGFLLFIGVVACVINLISSIGLGILTKVDVKGKGRAMDQDRPEQRQSSEDVGTREPLLPESPEMIYDTVETRVRGPPVVIYDEVDVTGMELFKDVEAWGFFLAFFCFTGTGLMYINSVGSIISSLYTSSTTHDPSSFLKLFTLAHYAGITRPPLITIQSLHVSVISIMSCTGRVLAGVISDFHKRVLHMSRLWTFALFSIIMVIGQSLGAFYVSRLENLMCVTVLTGLAYGGVFSVSPTITAEFWGVTRFGTNWGFLSLAPAIGGLVSNVVFGAVYDEENRRQHEQFPSTTTCEGVACFRNAFIFNLASCLLGLCFVLLVSHRRHNRKMNFKRQKLIEYAED